MSSRKPNGAKLRKLRSAGDSISNLYNNIGK